MKILTAILLLTALCSTACFFGARERTTDANRPETPDNQTTANEKSAAGTNSNPAESRDERAKPAVPADCLSIKVPGKKIDEKQTFAFDREPFKNSCFVTAHDPDFDDPPLDSEFFIYRDGREIYKFPNQFNGVTAGCWVEAVAFQDLNDDNLTDIVIAGLCSAKTAPYSENMVYVNTGAGFRTSEEANYTLEKFKKIKDITDFVKQNKEQFFQ